MRAKCGTLVVFLADLILAHLVGPSYLTLAPLKAILPKLENQPDNNKMPQILGQSSPLGNHALQQDLETQTTQSHVKIKVQQWSKKVIHAPTPVLSFTLCHLAYMYFTHGLVSE